MHSKPVHMKHSEYKKALRYAIFVVFCSLKTFSQDDKINLFQDSKFEKLLNEKRRIFAGNIADDNFKIQIFNGVTDEAKRTLLAFRREFPELESTVVFNTPNYKVIAGNFKTRIEAERNLLAVKKVYKNALLIRPRK